MRELVVDWLWWVNQFVSIFFAADMCLSFFTSFRESAAKGAGVVKNLSRIRRNYFHGWFSIDLISVFPFGYLPIKGASTLGILRMVRILRLLKLSRVLRASRIYKRFQSRNSFPHSVESMFQIGLLLLMLTHWMACAWILTASLQSDDEYTWLDKYSESYFCSEGVCDDEPARLHALREPSETYFGALYWSVVTVTSVGYGDITPQNPSEMFVCTCYLLFGALMWANIVGEIVTVLSTGDPDMIEHHQTMDHLNRFVVEKRLPKELAMRLRQFFLSRLALSRQGGDQELQNKLSPSLVADVSDYVSSWLREFSFFADTQKVSAMFIVELQRELVESLYEPRERIPWRDQFCYQSRGVASIAGTLFMTPGYIWGHDCVLDSEQLKDKRDAHALTYVAILSVPKGAYLEVLSNPKFHEERAHIRKKALLLAVQRAVLATAARRSKGNFTFSQMVKEIVAKNVAAKSVTAPAPARQASMDLLGSAVEPPSSADDLVASVMLETFDEVARRAEALLARRLDEQRAAVGGRLKARLQASAAASPPLPLPPGAFVMGAAPPQLPPPPGAVMEHYLKTVTGAAPWPLPAGWSAVLSEAHQGVVYVHAPSGASSWERPVQVEREL
jgi:hypothetical protein